MGASFHWLDITMLVLYALLMIGMGVYYKRKTRTSEEFMVAGRTIPAWAAGLAVMGAYTSSISYVAVPGKAFLSNWHPLLFALAVVPVAWVVCRYAVPYYRKMKLISVYSFLEERLGQWGRAYAALVFILLQISRIAVILYLVALVFRLVFFTTPQAEEGGNEVLIAVIVIIGLITIFYTLLGGMQAVIWTDVVQSIIMIGALAYCAIALSVQVFSGPEPLIASAWPDKFSPGSLDFDLKTRGFVDRTIWAMIIFAVVENLRNLLTDQNYVQKFASCPTEREAKRSIWIAMGIYIPLTAIFVYIGTCLWAYYSPGTELQDAGIITAETTKGDSIFPYYIANQLPPGLRGLMVAAIVAAAMSTISSAFNCAATVSLLDFYKKYLKPDLSDRGGVIFLRIATLVWGLVGTGCALLMLGVKSILDIWWQVSGIFGGPIVGLFLLSLIKIRVRLWQGLVSVIVSIAIIAWATFVREGSMIEGTRLFDWLSSKLPLCTLDAILIGAMGTGALMVVAVLFGLTNRNKELTA
ncbi:MAG: sodium:solute symporter family transporter [Planctomycetota bacterium]|jgi:SSS family solute:Na+ symporter